MQDKKYELTDETKVVGDVTLRRIRALKDFGDVKAGALGGWIEKEENLSQDGDCWVSDAACVSGDAWVLGAACVSGDAWVSGDARVSGAACVSDDAWVSDAACVSGDARVSGRARVLGDACVSGDARVSGGTWGKSPLQIQSSKYFVNMANLTDLKIGCKVHPITWWLENNEKHAEEEGDTPEIAAEMRLYIELAAKLYGANTYKEEQEEVQNER